MKTLKSIIIPFLIGISISLIAWLLLPDWAYHVYFGVLCVSIAVCVIAIKPLREFLYYTWLYCRAFHIYWGLRCLFSALEDVFGNLRNWAYAKYQATLRKMDAVDAEWDNEPTTDKE